MSGMSAFSRMMAYGLVAFGFDALYVASPAKLAVAVYDPACWFRRLPTESSVAAIPALGPVGCVVAVIDCVPSVKVISALPIVCPVFVSVSFAARFAGSLYWPDVAPV